MNRLVVENLTIRFPEAGRRGPNGEGPGGSDAGRSAAVVEDLSFAMEPGDSVALTGLSGTGKTQVALAILGLSPEPAIVSGRIRWGDTDLLGASDAEWRAIRAREIAMVFQDPGAALNPHRRIGKQIELILERHGIASGKAARSRVLEMLERVGLPDPSRQARAYPHQLSGGMQQRAMIAAALIAEPTLLIADEPTTALDSTVQAQILTLLTGLVRDAGCALLLITHDFGVIAQSAERLLVMDAGRLVEAGPTDALLSAPEHPATRRLLHAAAEVVDRGEPGEEPVLDTRDLAVTYRERPAGGFFRELLTPALRPASLSIRRGETVALVGESGSGKTSLARALAGLVTASGGRVCLLDELLPLRLEARSRPMRAAQQMVFQNPVASLDPTMRVGSIIEEPLKSLAPELAPAERRDRARAMALKVGCEAALLDRRPGELSGGQAQRVALARALVVAPALLIADEAVAALDGPVRQQILESLAAEQRERGLAVLFISHDLGVVRRLSHRVVVLYMGFVVEIGPTDTLFARPRHPYTRALLDAAPVAEPGRRDFPEPLPGEPGSLHEPPPGCVFAPRCRYAEPACRSERPELTCYGGHEVACLRAESLDLSETARQVPA